MEKDKTVLVVEVVEDDASVQNALIEKLTREGFSVLAAKNGQEGMELALKKHPHLILLDIKMPIMDGLTMLNILRADEWGKSVPVIVLSNATDSDSVAKAIDKNAFDYFIKTNISIEDIVKKIREKITAV